MISILKPALVKPCRVETPQCEMIIPADTRFDVWRKGRYERMRPHMDPNKCQRESVVAIDGRCYCKLHAGQIALEKWLAGELKDG